MAPESQKRHNDAGWCSSHSQYQRTYWTGICSSSSLRQRPASSTVVYPVHLALSTLLDPPVPCGTVDSRCRQRTRSTAIVSTSLQLIAQLLLLVCLQKMLPAKCSLSILFFSYHQLLVSNPLHSAGRSDAIRRMCPANRNLLSPTVS